MHTHGSLPSKAAKLSAYNFNSSFTSMKTCIQQPRRGMTRVASHFNGWDKSAGGMRAVGTRPATAFCRVPKGTPSIVTADIPAIKMAGYHCQMPTASVLRDLRNLYNFKYKFFYNFERSDHIKKR